LQQQMRHASRQCSRGRYSSITTDHFGTLAREPLGDVDNGMQRDAVTEGIARQGRPGLAAGEKHLEPFLKGLPLDVQRTAARRRSRRCRFHSRAKPSVPRSRSVIGRRSSS
jgi:hypothetical protein